MKEEKNILEGGNIIVEAMMLKVLSVFKEYFFGDVLGKQDSSQR